VIRREAVEGIPPGLAVPQNLETVKDAGEWLFRGALEMIRLRPEIFRRTAKAGEEPFPS